MRQRVRIASRIAFVFFLFAFLARPLRDFKRTKLTRFFCANRRQLGLSAAFSQTVFILLVTWTYAGIDRPLDEILNFREKLFGYSGMAMYAALALTSNRLSVRLLGRNWRRLHIAGAYYLWFLYVDSYLPGALDGRHYEYYFPIALLVAALALRIYVFFASRRYELEIRGKRGVLKKRWLSPTS